MCVVHLLCSFYGNNEQKRRDRERERELERGSARGMERQKDRQGERERERARERERETERAFPSSKFLWLSAGSTYPAEALSYSSTHGC